MKNDNGEMNGIIAGIFCIFFIVLIATCICIPLLTQDNVTLKVDKKDTYSTTSCDKNGCTTELNNLLYTNGEILQFNDIPILWVWGSQTAFSHVIDGKTYKFKVYGFNVPWLNWYRTVISYEGVP